MGLCEDGILSCLDASSLVAGLPSCGYVQNDGNPPCLAGLDELRTLFLGLWRLGLHSNNDALHS